MTVAMMEVNVLFPELTVFHRARQRTTRMAEDLTGVVDVAEDVVET